MDTLALVIRYGFLVVLLVEAALLGRAFFGMLREKALRTAQGSGGAEGSAAAQE